MMCDVDACNAAAVHGPKCKYHTRAIDGLAVRKSRIPRAGSGLFATRGEAENEFVIRPYMNSKKKRLL